MLIFEDGIERKASDLLITWRKIILISTLNQEILFNRGGLKKILRGPWPAQSVQLVTLGLWVGSLGSILGIEST